MKGFQHLALAGAMALMTSTSASATAINLFEYAFNIDGAFASPLLGDTVPAGVNLAGFDTDTGLGTILVSVVGTGAHFVGLFVDHEIDEEENTFFNEVGDTGGSPAANQSWEIDEPGFCDTNVTPGCHLGDIYDNFQLSDETGSALDNSIGTLNPEDVSMAMGWNFSLVQNQTALIKFLVATTEPASGFYLRQADPDSLDDSGALAPVDIYLSSTIDFRSGGTGVPEPATLALLGIGLLGLWQTHRRQAVT